MVPLVTKLQVATTKSPTVDAISMLVIMPAKLTLSVPEVVPVVNSSNVASAGSAAVDYVFDKCSLTGCIWVVHQFNGARTADHAADKCTEGVTVIGNVQRVFGDVQSPAAGSNDGGVRRASSVKLDRTLLSAKDGHE